jgi:hypothetical protein
MVVVKKVDGDRKQTRYGEKRIMEERRKKETIEGGNNWKQRAKYTGVVLSITLMMDEKIK